MFAGTLTVSVSTVVMSSILGKVREASEFPNLTHQYLIRVSVVSHQYLIDSSYLIF